MVRDHRCPRCGADVCISPGEKPSADSPGDAPQVDCLGKCHLTDEEQADVLAGVEHERQEYIAIAKLQAREDRREWAYREIM